MRRLACIGGGPAGLFTALLAKKAFPSAEVTVYERNNYDATFGFGVVFSDETLGNIAAADPIAFERIEAEFRYWSDLEIRCGGDVTRSTGHGFAAFSRLRLLQVLADRAREVGVEVRFETVIDDPGALEADLVVCADGVNSQTRARMARRFRPQVVEGSARYAWFGTDHDFEIFTFLFEETTEGKVVQAHCYPYAENRSTFIIEMAEDTWRLAGLNSARELGPGESDPEGRAFAEKLFGPHLDGHDLIGNNSRWIRFPEVTAEQWWWNRFVLLGDAAHTAHFSIGSGTKLAMEDAIALVDSLQANTDLAVALDEYQADRQPQVESTQRAARTSQDWFESVDRYWDLPRPQFDFQLLTRSQRITLDNLRERDPEATAEIVGWWRQQQPLTASPDTPPMFMPYRLRNVTFPNRVGVSPMAQYSAVDGLPNQWHMVHLGSRAVGGAGLVMVEMTCVSPEGRITPGCTGLWNDQQAEAFAPIVEFVHSHTPAVFGMQLGHSGRKGGMRIPWEVGDDDVVPVDEPWERLAPSPIAYLTDGPVPREMTDRHLAQVRSEYVAAAERARDLGFDLLELHMAHGYLLSSFISPLTNHRGDEYGGEVGGRMRYPLEIVDAVRAVWPEELPLSVRISAADWAEGGTSGDDAVEMARMFRRHGVDIMDVSSGQVVPYQRPRYGRLWQTPFADRIRLETGMPTMTVGAVSSVDDVNTVLVAGRADLCLLARPHLVDPYWTLNSAIDQQYPGHPWPDQYLSGQTARRREQDPYTRL